jgi:hypothetical protein
MGTDVAMLLGRVTPSLEQRQYTYALALELPTLFSLLLYIEKEGICMYIFFLPNTRK